MKKKNKKSKGIKHISKIRSGLKYIKKWKYKNESNMYKVRIKKLLIKKIKGLIVFTFSWIRWDLISGSYLIWIVCDCEVLSVSYCYSVIVILSQLLLFIVQLARRGFVGQCNGLARWALKLSHWRGAIGSADWRVAHPWCNTWISSPFRLFFMYVSVRSGPFRCFYVPVVKHKIFNIMVVSYFNGVID